MVVNIVVNIDDLKELQKKIIKKDKTCNLVSAICLGTIILFTLFMFLKNGFSMIFLYVLVFELVFYFVISIIVKSIVNGSDISKFNKEYKSIFVLSALESTFEDLTYDFKNGFSKQTIVETGIFDTCDRFSSNDYISGRYKNIKFEQSDIHIEEEHEEVDKDGDRKTWWETVFKGRIMIFDFNKKFMANMLVVSANFPARILFRSKKMSKVKMEDTKFNSEFSVYSDLEHDAFYILTPHFMEKIRGLYSQLGCGIMFGFLNNKLYVAVDNKEDSFEYDVFKPINKIDIKRSITKDIEVITDFVNELDLDNDLFKGDA